MTDYVLIATLWRDPQGVRHRRGDIITPPDADVRRLLQARAIAPVNEADPTEAEQVAAQAQPEQAKQTQTQIQEQPAAPAESLERPKNAAAKPVWEAYAIKRGVENAAELNKDQIIDAVNALDAK